MSEKLKPCPCGKTPTKLVLEEGATCKYAYCGGNCCGSWLVEFPTGYAHVSSYAAMELAIEAWNGARRKDETPNLSDTLAEYFGRMRHDDCHHIGLGDIRITFAQQDDIIAAAREMSEATIKQLMEGGSNE